MKSWRKKESMFGITAVEPALLWSICWAHMTAWVLLPALCGDKEEQYITDIANTEHLSCSIFLRYYLTRTLFLHFFLLGTYSRALHILDRPFDTPHSQSRLVIYMIGWMVVERTCIRVSRLLSQKKNIFICRTKGFHYNLRRLGMVVHSCKPSLQEDKARGSQV